MIRKRNHYFILTINLFWTKLKKKMKSFLSILFAISLLISHASSDCFIDGVEFRCVNITHLSKIDAKILKSHPVKAIHIEASYDLVLNSDLDLKLSDNFIEKVVLNKFKGIEIFDQFLGNKISTNTFWYLKSRFDFYAEGEKLKESDCNIRTYSQKKVFESMEEITIDNPIVGDEAVCPYFLILNDQVKKFNFKYLNDTVKRFRFLNVSFKKSWESLRILTFSESKLYYE